MHLAALKAVGESVSLPLKYYSNNVLGSANLLEVSHSRTHLHYVHIVNKFYKIGDDGI